MRVLTAEILSDHTTFATFAYDFTISLESFSDDRFIVQAVQDLH